MTTDQLQQIVDFVNETEEMLVEYDGDFVTWNVELTKLHDIIKRLMDASAQSGDGDYRVLLAAIEHKARLCRKTIINRLALKG